MLPPLRSTAADSLWNNQIVKSMRTRQYATAFVVCTIILLLSFTATGAESVREELIRLQRESGLTFAWIDRGIQAVSFKERTVVELHGPLQDFRPDSFDSTDYPQVSTINTCWSRDQQKLVDTMVDRRSGRVSLELLDLVSKRSQVIAINVDQKSYVTSQCWAPDGKQLVYEMDDAVRLYGLDNDRSDAVAKGRDPTWSPDGNWIAFRDGETYYAMHPDGSGRKKLFRNHWGGAISGLYWSPDSRIVAYVRELGFLQGGALDAEVNQLRARRLEDGSDEALCPDSVDWFANFHWIHSSELMNRSAHGRH